MHANQKPKKTPYKGYKGFAQPHHKKRDSDQFYTYIYKVLKQVHPDMGCNTSAMQVMNALDKYVLMRLCETIRMILMSSEKKTVDSRDVQTAVRLVIPGELGKHAVSEGTKAVAKAVSALAKDGKHVVQKAERREKKAGLQFPVGRIEGMMRKFLGGYRLGSTASVYTAGVIEYVTAEVLELGGNATRDNKRVRLSRRDIFVAIQNDEELATLFKPCTLVGGVIPNINAKLLKKK